MRAATIGLAGRPSAGRRIAPPAGLGFPFSTYPLVIRQRGGRFLTDFRPEAHAAAALAGPSYYVDIATGNDANAGTAWGSAVRSIFRATQLGNGGGVAFQVRVKAGTYPRASNFTDNGTMVVPTQDAAYRAEGGRVTCWAGNDLTWPATPEASYPDCYRVSRGNTLRVLDLAHETPAGDRVEFVKVADVAACQSLPGSWAQVGSDLYLHRADGVAPTNANTRALLVVDAFALDGTAKSVYLEGFDFEGGSNGGVFAHDAAVRDLIFVDCSAKFAGGAAYLFDAFRVQDTTGLVAFVRCVAACAAKDGFNLHWSLGGTPGLAHLAIDCDGHGNGRYSSLSNNGLTSHDGIVGIDVGGRYRGNYGANLASIGSSRLWCVGTIAGDSLGDTSLGGVTGPRDFNTQDSARYWLEQTQSFGSAVSLAADGSSTSLKRRHRTGVGQVEQAGAGATIAAF
jgi:hypothetical protein